MGKDIRHNLCVDVRVDVTVFFTKLTKILQPFLKLAHILATFSRYNRYIIITFFRYIFVTLFVYFLAATVGLWIPQKSQNLHLLLLLLLLLLKVKDVTNLMCNAPAFLTEPQTTCCWEMNRSIAIPHHELFGCKLSLPECWWPTVLHYGHWWVFLNML